jgi:hypothetical protein
MNMRLSGQQINIQAAVLDAIRCRVAAFLRPAVKVFEVVASGVTCQSSQQKR